MLLLRLTRKLFNAMKTANSVYSQSLWGCHRAVDEHRGWSAATRPGAGCSDRLAAHAAEARGSQVGLFTQHWHCGN